MLRKMDVQDCKTLYHLLKEPDMIRYIREKPISLHQYIEHTIENKKREENGELIMRVITNERNEPIGVISLFDIIDHTGFLATWLGKPYQGYGYNQRAKDQFLSELFTQHAMETVFVKIRKENTRSRNAALKLPYLEIETHTLFPMVDYEVFDVYHITKNTFFSYLNEK